jgi:hypothetical protein
VGRSAQEQAKWKQVEVKSKGVKVRKTGVEEKYTALIFPFSSVLHPEHGGWLVSLKHYIPSLISWSTTVLNSQPRDPQI